MVKNPSWIQLPARNAEVDKWRLEDRPFPEATKGQLLVKTIWLSVDPYMRARISQARNYASGFSLGDLMTGGGVGEVISSESPTSDLVTS